MNERYFRLWRLLQERIAKRTKKEEKYSTEKTLCHELLAEMSLLEAEAVLEE